MTDFIYAFDGSDWSFYVPGHDPEGLRVLSDPDELIFAPLWMQPIRASEAEDFGVDPDDDGETVERGPDGRFRARVLWIECSEGDAGAEPWMGVSYRPLSRADSVGASGAVPGSAGRDSGET